MIQDEFGTHLDWALEGVTARMIDWFWSNMEKGFLLWHPQEHEPLTWLRPPRHGDLTGAVHVAPQTWSDGTRRNLYIRFEALADVPLAIRERVAYDHCIVVAGLGLEAASVDRSEPMGYRLHQWQASDAGVVGRSSAVPETGEAGLVWARHCAQEVGNWRVFLPQLHALYSVVTDPHYNPFAELLVEGSGATLRYRALTASS